MMSAAGRTLLYLPALNAAGTLERTLSEIPPGAVDDVLLVDDGSRDGTADLARRLGLRVIAHPRNLGYGASQKTAYREVLKRGYGIVAMLHPDLQHDGRLLPSLIQPVRDGTHDIVLGARIRARAEAAAGGMPLYKYAANRLLSRLQNLIFDARLSEWHTGYRVYSRRFLQEVAFELNSDGFVLDSEMLLQAVMLGFRIGEVPVPVRYGPGCSSIGLRPACRYAAGTLAAVGSCLAHRAGLSTDRRWLRV